MTTVQESMTARTATGGARIFVRRLYFYGMTLISLIVGLVAVDNLLLTLDRVWLDRATVEGIESFVRDSIAAAGGALLVATPIFLVHWRVVQGWREADERRSALRKLALYVASGVGVGYAIFLGFQLLRGIALLAFGASITQSGIWPSGWLRLAVMVVIGLALRGYFQSVLRADGDRGDEDDWAGTWRRLYMSLAGAAGLFLVIWGGASLLGSLLRAALEPFVPAVNAGWWLLQSGDALAQLLIGTLLLRLNWLDWSAITQAHPQEAQTALRRFYLYAAVVGGALAALIPATRLLTDLLLIAFGQLDASDPLVAEAVIRLLSYTPIGLAVWVWHARFLHREAETYGESSQGATVRRIYTYTVAAVGLALFWSGVLNVMQVLLDWGFGRIDGTVGGLWVQPLASGLSLLAVGAPIWANRWNLAQRAARRTDAEGQSERASGPRKVYLYGVALVGALVILFFLAQVVYRILLALLGDPNVRLFDMSAVGDLAQSGLAAVFWVIHVFALRGDAQLGTEAPAASAPSEPERRSRLEARIAALERELAELRRELAALDATHGPGGPGA